MSSYDYVNVLCTDSAGFRLSVSQRVKSVSGTNMTTERGNMVRVLIRDGVVEALWGPANSTSIWPGGQLPGANFEVEGGARSEAELRQGDYLEVVEFSAFDVDAVSGGVAGEIRRLPAPGQDRQRHRDHRRRPARYLRRCGPVRCSPCSLRPTFSTLPR